MVYVDVKHHVYLRVIRKMTASELYKPYVYILLRFSLHSKIVWYTWRNQGILLHYKTTMRFVALSDNTPFDTNMHVLKIATANFVSEEINLTRFLRVMLQNADCLILTMLWLLGI